LGEKTIVTSLERVRSQNREGFIYVARIGKGPVAELERTSTDWEWVHLPDQTKEGKKPAVPNGVKCNVIVLSVLRLDGRVIVLEGYCRHCDSFTR